MISDYDKAHMEEILRGEGSWFTAHLLRLIAKADTGNKERLRLAFPEVVEAYEAWYRGNDPLGALENQALAHDDDYGRGR